MRCAQGNPAAGCSMRAVKLGILVLLWCVLWHSQYSRAQMQQRLFDLPAAPLKQTLESYDSVTGLSVFYSSELIVGRTSSPLKGVYNDKEALAQLLKGTGLTVKVAAADAFVLVPVSDADQQQLAAVALQSRQYSELVQAHIVQELCLHDEVALGQYRLALLLALDNQGRVRNVRLLDTSGNSRRDETIAGIVKAVDIGRGPGDTDKPFVILIKPDNDVAAVCARYH